MESLIKITNAWKNFLQIENENAGRKIIISLKCLIPNCETLCNLLAQNTPLHIVFDLCTFIFDQLLLIIDDK